jgi:pyruvate/2-oxoglutarate dehydrogenase complex dihydrolipoamide acyltransferase (E2) component
MAQHVFMPRLSQDMTQGRIVEWLAGEGAAVKAGDPLVSVETDKAVTDVQAPCSGVLRRVLFAPGQDADVGTPLAILAGPDEDIDSLLQEVAEPAATRAAQASTPAPAPHAAAGRAETRRASSRQPVSPAARRLARELGVDLPGVAGTGAGGLVTETDVRAFAARAQAVPAAETPENVDVIPLTGVRRRIAERMALSRQSAADVTTVLDVDMTAVSALRETSGLSYTAYVVSVAAATLREFPILNSSLDTDRILVKRDIHIGVAVALDEGLVVPVVRFADRKSVEEVAREIDALAARARDGQLDPGEMTGGTFTVSNSGALGSLHFTPIINHPEVAILGMGKVMETPVARNGQVVVRKVMYACLSYDHRVVDGAPAVRFLNTVKHRLEHLGVHDKSHV